VAVGGTDARDRALVDIHARDTVARVPKVARALIAGTGKGTSHRIECEGNQIGASGQRRVAVVCARGTLVDVHARVYAVAAVRRRARARVAASRVLTQRATEAVVGVERALVDIVARSNSVSRVAVVARARERPRGVAARCVGVTVVCTG
jgi:hypothetical protein